MIIEENRFFKLIWRFNGLIISIAGLLTVLWLLFVMFQSFDYVTQERQTNNVVNIQTDNSVKENWMLGSFVNLTGHKSIMAPLYSGQNFEQSYFSKSTNSIRNYLFIDPKTYSNSWLLPHTNYLIQRTTTLTIDKNYDSKAAILAILYSLVKLDSNNDQRLTSSDKLTLAISKPDGSDYKEILMDIDSLIDTKVLSEKKVLILYQSKGDFFNSVLDLESYRLIHNASIPRYNMEM